MRWYAWALVLPPFLVGIAGLVHVVVFGASLDLGAINPLWIYPIAIVVVFLVGGGQEELGWRAFALPTLYVGPRGPEQCSQFGTPSSVPPTGSDQISDIRYIRRQTVARSDRRSTVLAVM